MPFTEFTCRSGGSNLYAGTLDGSAEASTTPLVTYTNGGWNSGTGVFTPASGNPVSAGVAVGNFVSVYTDAASAPTGFVARVTAVSSTTITLSTTAKSGTAPTTAGTGITAVVGGAWQGPNGTSSFPFNFAASPMTNSTGDSPRINFKNDQTYSITAAMTSTLVGPVAFQGYTTTFGDRGRATIDGGTTGASYVLLTVSSNGGKCYRDLIFQNNGATGSANGLASSGGNRNVYDSVVVNSVRGIGLSIGDNSVVVRCEAYACNQSNTSNCGGFSVGGATLSFCVSHDNTGSNSFGFGTAAANQVVSTFVNCVADTNGGIGFSLQGTQQISQVISCTSYNNTSDGIRISSSAGGAAYVQNSILSNNGGWGINNSSAVTCGITNNAYLSNTSGQVTANVASVFYNDGGVTLSGAPFTNAASGDFSLNNTAGAGASCRGAGIGTFPTTQGGYGSTLGYPDIGAVQHQDAGGAAGMLFIPCLAGV